MSAGENVGTAVTNAGFLAEVFAGKDQLAGKPVVVRGKVVKTNANIMGKNWLHVRDGSGAEGTNDLTVTMAGTAPNVGDTVVVKGTVALNKDFGSVTLTSISSYLKGYFLNEVDGDGGLGRAGDAGALLRAPYPTRPRADR